METFNETGSGGIKPRGFALVSNYRTYFTKYGPGDVVYNVRKAKNGILERVVIKKFRILNSYRASGRVDAIYTDTLNALWNEEDLVGHSQAIHLASSYHAKLLAEIEDSIC